MEPVEPVQKHLPKQYLKKRCKLTMFQQWAKGSREAASREPTFLHINFCSLSNISK